MVSFIFSRLKEPKERQKRLPPSSSTPLACPCPGFTHPWVQLAWQGWHSLLASAYLKMKLLAPCRPSGHFSTQLGPSLKWRHFTQCSGPCEEWEKTKHCFFRCMFSFGKHRVAVKKMNMVGLHITISKVLARHLTDDYYHYYETGD